MRLLSSAAILAFLVSNALAADTTRFVGTWTVDFDRTMEEVKKSPKYQAEDQHLPGAIRMMMEALTLRITDQAITFVQGSNEISLPFTVQSGDGNSVVLSVSRDGKTITITLSSKREGFLNLRSSASDDLDYYIWRRVQS